MKKILLLSMLVIFLGSCIKDITDTIDKIANTDSFEWNPTIAVPLIYSNLTFEDILNEVGEQQYLRVEADGSLTAVYTDEYTSKTAEEVLQLPNQAYGETIQLSALQLGQLNSNGSVTIDINTNLGYVFGGNEIDKIWFKGGSSEVSLSTTLQHDITLSMTIKGSNDDGNEFAEVVIYEDGNSDPDNGVSTYSLDGVEIDFTQTASLHSEMEADFSIVVTKKGSNPIGPLETITYGFELQDQGFSQVTGFFDVTDFNTTGDSIELSLFSNSTAGSFTLADPRVEFVFTNSIGLPIDARITEFTGTNSDNNSLSLTGIPDPLPIPNLSFAEIGQTKSDSFALNKNTSNLADYVNNRPSNNFYKISVNPNNSSGTRHWLVDSSRIRAKVKLEVPLEGTAEGYTLEASQQFNLELENVSDIKEVLVRLYTENGFPVDVGTQLYFEDSVSNTVLDSLMSSDNLILPSGDIDAAGKVISANPKTTDVIFSSARIQDIQNANRIRIKAYFNTPYDSGGTSQPDVKFYKDNNLLLQLGVQAEVLIEQEF